MTSLLAAALTVVMLLAMAVMVIRFEVRMFRRGREFDKMVAGLDLGDPRRRTEIRKRIRSTPPGAAPVVPMGTLDTERRHA